jgi:hypothetical protein
MRRFRFLPLLTSYAAATSRNTSTIVAVNGLSLLEALTTELHAFTGEVGCFYTESIEAFSTFLNLKKCIVLLRIIVVERPGGI